MGYKVVQGIQGDKGVEVQWCSRYHEGQMLRVFIVCSGCPRRQGCSEGQGCFGGQWCSECPGRQPSECVLR